MSSLSPKSAHAAQQAEVVLVASDVWQAYSTTYGPLDVLAGISASVRRGEIVALMGPSGCGKSTLLRVLAGHEAPARGRVELHNADAGITLLAQDDTLLPFRTALQNVLLPHELMGRLDHKHLKDARSMISDAGLSGFEDAFPDQMSGGMQKRTLTCQHLTTDRSIYFFDEPFAALDLYSADLMIELIRAKRDASNAAFILVLHDVGIAASLCDVVYTLSARPARMLGVHSLPAALLGLAPSDRRRHTDFDSFELDVLRSLRMGAA